MDRQTIKDVMLKCANVLEIGPFTNAFLTGENVKYFDTLDREDLLQRAKEINFPTTNIPAIIDYCSNCLDFSIISEHFDAAFSSHCIEHAPDLIYHFNSVSRILNEGGKYYLAIPDKRYCFDHFISTSSLAGVLQAYMEKRKVHTVQSIIEHRAYTTHNSAASHWAGDHGTPTFIIERVVGAISEYNRSSGKYVDVHAWQFTPQSFREIALSLFEMNITEFYPTTITETQPNTFEFYAVLEKRKKLVDTDIYSI